MRMLWDKIVKFIAHEPNYDIINGVNVPLKVKCSECENRMDSFAILTSGKVLCRVCYQTEMKK